MNRFKKSLSVVLKMILCTLVYFVFMYIFMLYEIGTDALTKKGIFYPASIIFEMFALISYMLVFKKNIKKTYDEGVKFEWKEDLKEYYFDIGKSHLIFYSIFFAFGVICALFSLDLGQVFIIITIPLSGIFAGSFVILGMIIGYVLHILAIAYLVILIRLINYRKRKNRNGWVHCGF